MDTYLLNPLRFYWFQFLTGFCFHLLLPLVLLFLVAILIGRVGRRHGVPYLVQHENPIKQFFAGLALGMLCGKILLVGFLLETRKPPARPGPFGPQPGSVLVYLVGLVVSIVVTVGFFWAVQRLFQRSRPPRKKLERAAAPVPLFFSLAVVVAGFVALILLPNFESDTCKTIVVLISDAGHATISEMIEQVNGWNLLREPLKPIPAEFHYYHGLALVSTGFVVVFYLIVYLLYYYFSAAVTVCFVINVVVATYGFLYFYIPPFMPVFYLTLALLILLGGIPKYKQQFPGLEPFYAQPKSLQTYAQEANTPTAPLDPALLQTDEIAFTGRDLGVHRPGCKRPLVLVCVSGGGLSAAAWTLAVLQRLENELAKANPPIWFPYHVRVITGSSGGMVGAAYYTATLPRPVKVPSRTPEKQEEQYNKLTEDSLSPVLSRLAFGDWLFFLPLLTGRDRGRALEKAWVRNLNKGLPRGEKTLNTTFGELLPKEQEGWLPSLIFSPLIVEDGRRLLISNLDLSRVASNTGNFLHQINDLYSREAYEFFRLFPRLPKDGTASSKPTRDLFQLATAARMSASFPFVSPAVPLPTEPRRRVVDAGYFDDYGVGLAALWLLQNRRWVQEHASGVVLIQIRNSVDETFNRLKPDLFAEGDTSTLWTRGAEELTSPLEAVLAMRRTAATFRNDEVLELLSQYFNEVQLRAFIERLSPEQIQQLVTELRLRNPRDLELAAHDAPDSLVRRLRTLSGPGGQPLFEEPLLKDLPRYLDQKRARLYFTTVLFEFPGEASLSWYLTKAERRRLLAEAQTDKTIAARLQELRQWWQSLPVDEPVG